LPRPPSPLLTRPSVGVIALWISPLARPQGTVPGDTAHASKPSSPWKSKSRARGCGVPPRACGTARGTSRPTAFAGCSVLSSWRGRPA